MSASNPRVGEAFVNKFGLREIRRTTGKNRVKLTSIDQLDRIWLAHAHGILRPDERTTHIRITCDEVEPHGIWVIAAGSYLIDIDNNYAGEQFDHIVPLLQGAIVRTTLHGMQRENAADVWIQELIIEDNDGN